MFLKKESYSINKSKITVSGVSSGAAMASQMHIAYSSVMDMLQKEKKVIVVLKQR